VVLEIRASNPEYERAQRQIWDIFEAEHPHVTVELFSVTEGTSAAMDAKLAGGWRPAIERAASIINKDNYQNFVNILEIDFPWWDRYDYDATKCFEHQFGIEGFTPAPGRIFIGRVVTWQYHKDLMDEAGLDPRRDVQTWDDLMDFLTAGAEWVATQPNLDYFWDQSLDEGWIEWMLAHILPMAFPDGQRDRQRQCYLGEIPFNAADSPYRYLFELCKEFYDKDLVPKTWTTREWEADMEASYISKKSVMMLHGPWTWDKMIAADPAAQQEGFPATPPAEGQDQWMQFMTDVATFDEFQMYKEVLDWPEWPDVLAAYNFIYSPSVVKMRAEIEGQPVIYQLDEPLELQGAQWDGILKELFNDDGLYSHVEVEQSPTGSFAAGRFIKEGALGPFAPTTGNLAALMDDLMQERATVQDALDWLQMNWEESYEGLPL